MKEPTFSERQYKGWQKSEYDEAREEPKDYNFTNELKQFEIVDKIKDLADKTQAAYEDLESGRMQILDLDILERKWFRKLDEEIEVKILFDKLDKPYIDEIIEEYQNFLDYNSVLLEKMNDLIKERKRADFGDN